MLPNRLETPVLYVLAAYDRSAMRFTFFSGAVEKVVYTRFVEWALSDEDDEIVQRYMDQEAYKAAADFVAWKEDIPFAMHAVNMNFYIQENVNALIDDFRSLVYARMSDGFREGLK